MADNGQKGKSRVEIARLAHEKAETKAEATRARLELAEAAGSVRADKRRDKAGFALERAIQQCRNAGLVIVSSADGEPTGDIHAEFRPDEEA